MDRKLTVEFGPSRSKRFGKALAEAENGPGALRELEPGRYRASFVLGSDAAAYTALARLLERVRHWRASEVRQGEEPVSAFHAKDIDRRLGQFGLRGAREPGEGRPLSPFRPSGAATVAWLLTEMIRP